MLPATAKAEVEQLPGSQHGATTSGEVSLVLTKHETHPTQSRNHTLCYLQS